MKLSEKVKTLIFAGVLAVAGIGAVAVATPSAFAGTKSAVVGNPSGGLNGIKQGANNTNADTGKSFDPYDLAQKAVSWLLWGVGVASVIVIIIGGVMYTTSSGDQQKVTKAKNTILYGIIGLIIAVLAYGIVNFVLDSILK